MFDGVEIWRVSWQRQQLVPLFGEDFGDFWFVMKWRVVHDDKALRPERGQQHLPDPCCHRQMCAACFEQHGRNPVSVSLRHDEIGSFMVSAGDSAKDLVAPRRPAMWPVSAGLKTALVEIHDILPAVLGDKGAQLPQKCDSLLATTFTIPGRFFW